MKRDLHKIDELFKKAIEDQQENPPAGVWNAIDKELDKSKVISIQRKYNYLKRVAVALVIFCFMASVYALYLHNHTSKESIQNISDKERKFNLSKERKDKEEIVQHETKNTNIEIKNTK